METNIVRKYEGHNIYQANLQTERIACGIVFTENIDFYTGLFISPSGTSELDCATTKTDTTERSISVGRESLKAFFLY